MLSMPSTSLKFMLHKGYKKVVLFSPCNGKDKIQQNKYSLQSFIQQKYNQDEILIGLSCQVILPILFKFVFPNYIRLSLYLFVNSTIESLYIPIFSSLFSIWIFLLFRLVPYCLIIFHVFFCLMGFLWFWRIARNTTQKVLILLLFRFVPFSTIKSKNWNKVLHCSMVHHFKLYYVFFFNLIFLMKKLYYVDKTKFRNLVLLLLIASSLRCNCSQLYRILFFFLFFGYGFFPQPVFILNMLMKW